MQQVSPVKLDYQRRRPQGASAPPRPDPSWTWVGIVGMAAALCAAIAALVVAVSAQSFHAKLVAVSVLVAAYVTFVWLCCLVARGRGYHPAWGLVGVTLLGGLVVPFLPYDEDEERLLVAAPRAPYWVGARHVISLFLAYGFILAAFWNSFESGWVLDNLYIIKLDPRTQGKQWSDPPAGNVLREPGVVNYFTQDYWWPKGISGLYRPLTSITYWVNGTLLGNGEDTTGFHVVNLVVHWLNAALVYALAFVLTRRWAVATIASLIFAVHPITTESVTNIIGRADLFAALAVLGGVLVWRWAGALPRWWTIAGFAAVMLITAWGVFSKESALAIGLVILMYDLIYRWHPTVAKWFAVLVGLALIPAVSGGVFAIEHPWWKHLHALARSIIALVVLVAGCATHVMLTRAMPNNRFRVLLIGLGFAVLASAFWPAAGVVLFAAIVAYEFFTGPWLHDHFPEFERIKWPAVLYTAGFVACVFLPLAFGALVWFKTGGGAKEGVVGALNVLGGSWLPDPSQQAWALTFGARVSRAALFVGMGLLTWLFFTSRDRVARLVMLIAVGMLSLLAAIFLDGGRLLPLIASGVAVVAAVVVGVLGLAERDGDGDKETDNKADDGVRPWLALPVLMLSALAASLFVFYAGFAVTFAVGLIELVRQKFVPRIMRDSALWADLVRRFVVGYYLLLPPVITMYFVRYWIFNIQSTPPETPFLDNPLRGGPFDPLPFWQSRMTAVKVMGKLIYLLLWPVHLTSDYSWDQIPFFRDARGPFVWENVKAIVALLTIAGAIALAVWSYRRGNKALSFFVLFFFAAILPTSNLPTLIGSIMAERFMYLPLIGFAGAVAIGLVKAFDFAAGAVDLRGERPALVWSRIGIGVAVLCVPFVLYTYRSYRRNFDWRSDITLWESAVVLSPRSFRCYQSLAFAYYEQDALGNVDKMIDTAERARPIVDPLPHDRNSSRLYLHLGMYYNIKGETLSRRDERGNLIVTDAARPWFGKAVEALERGVQVDRTFNEVNRRRQLARGDRPDRIYDSGLTPVYMTLGVSYVRLGMHREALNALQYQRQLEPENSDAYFRIALVHLDRQAFDEAAVALIQCVLLDSRRTDAINALAQVYSLGGARMQSAMIETPTGARLNVDHPVVREHFISAFRGFIRIFRWANRPQPAEMFRQQALFRYRMPPSLFDSLMTEPIPKVTPEGVEYPPASPGRVGAK